MDAQVLGAQMTIFMPDVITPQLDPNQIAPQWMIQHVLKKEEKTEPWKKRSLLKLVYDVQWI